MSPPILHALRWRYAAKHFDPARRIPAEAWAILEESLILTPSSFGLQPWKFFIVQTPALREQLVGACWGQRQVADCSHLVVLTTRTALTPDEIDAYFTRTVELRGGTVAEHAAYRGMMLGFFARHTGAQTAEWAAKQAYLALGQLMLTAALLEIDACPMEGFDPAKVNALLELDGTGYQTTLLCPLGYRAETDKYAALPKVRFPAEAVIERR